MVSEHDPYSDFESISQEESGTLVGKITYIAKFPSTFQGMMRILENKQLVQELSQGNTPIEVQVELIPNDKNVSGYEWSSGDGPSVKIYSGTLCTANVTVYKQAPITLVIPYLKKKFGL